MRTNKKKTKLIILLLLLLMLGIGFAALSTTLKINGSTTIKKNTWNVYWKNASVTPGSVSSDIPEITDDPDAEEGEGVNTIISWDTTLDVPGDYYEFTVDAVNDGSIDAMVTGIQSKVNGNDISTLPDYIKYSVTHIDGNPIDVNHKLGAYLSETYKIRVYYDPQATTATTINSMTDDDEYEFTFEVTYGQATSAAYFENVPSCQECNAYGWLSQQKIGYTIHPTMITGFTRDYRTLLNSRYEVVVGMVLDDDNVLLKAYTCRLKEEVPYCIEMTTTGDSYSNNVDVLQSKRVFNNTCTQVTSGSTHGIRCSSGNVSAGTYDSGGSYISHQVGDNEYTEEYTCNNNTSYGTGDPKETISCSFTIENRD